MRVLAVCGSLQAKSGNRSLLETVASLAPEVIDVVLFDGLRDLPLFDPDVEQKGSPPPVQSWRRALAESSAVLIASPEYGHSLPGALKNAVDWVIGTGELYHKVVSITTAVDHRLRGRRGLAALAQTLLAVDAIIPWSEPMVRGEALESQIHDMLRALIAAVDRTMAPSSID